MAQTHLSERGIIVDWGLMEALEGARQEAEGSCNKPGSKWHQRRQGGFLGGFWKPPKIVDVKVMEIGCGMGACVGALLSLEIRLLF